MRIAPYCRVSTDKADQLNSLKCRKNSMVNLQKETITKLFICMQMNML